MVIYKDLYPARGSFVAFAYEKHSVFFPFTNELWSSKQYYDKETQKGKRNGYATASKERLKYYHLVDFGANFVMWKAFKHPVYGNSELCGWRKMTNQLSPSDTLPELYHQNTAFTVFHTEQMPKISIPKTEIQKLGKSTHRIYVTVANSGAIPTISQQVAKNHIFRPDLLTIRGKNLMIISAARVRRDRWLNHLLPIKHRPARLLLSNGIPGLSSITYQWIASGKGKVAITLDCLKGGRVKKQFY